MQGYRDRVDEDGHGFVALGMKKPGVAGLLTTLLVATVRILQMMGLNLFRIDGNHPGDLSGDARLLLYRPAVVGS